MQSVLNWHSTEALKYLGFFVRKIEERIHTFSKRTDNTLI